MSDNSLKNWILLSEISVTNICLQVCSYFHLSFPLLRQLELSSPAKKSVEEKLGLKKYAANFPSCKERKLLLWKKHYRHLSSNGLKIWRYWIWSYWRHACHGRGQHYRNMSVLSASIWLTWSNSAQISSVSHPNRVMGLHPILRYICSPNCCKRERGNGMQFSLLELLSKEWVQQPQSSHTTVSGDSVQAIYWISSLFLSEFQGCALIFIYHFL